MVMNFDKIVINIASHGQSRQTATVRQRSRGPCSQSLFSIEYVINYVLSRQGYWRLELLKLSWLDWAGGTRKAYCCPEDRAIASRPDRGPTGRSQARIRENEATRNERRSRTRNCPSKRHVAKWQGSLTTLSTRTHQYAIKAWSWADRRRPERVRSGLRVSTWFVLYWISAGQNISCSILRPCCKLWRSW